MPLLRGSQSHLAQDSSQHRLSPTDSILSTLQPRAGPQQLLESTAKATSSTAPWLCCLWQGKSLLNLYGCKKMEFEISISLFTPMEQIQWGFQSHKLS